MSLTRAQMEALVEGLSRWADSLQKQIREHKDLKSLKPRQKVRQDSALFEILRQASTDSGLQNYLAQVGLAAAVPAAAPEALVAALKREEAASTSFDGFLSGLSESVVNAQRRLDVESARYLTGIGGQRHVMPSIFRMPKLSAHMRFAIQSIEGRKLNLLFYSRGTETTSRNEQGIDFEIVSVPAPPEALQSLERAAPGMDLLLDPFERREVAEAIRGVPGDEPLKPVIDASAKPEQLVILKLLPEKEGVRRYVVMYAEAEPGHAVGLWLLALAADGTPTLRAIYRFRRKNSPDEHLLHDLVMETIAAQIALFQRG